MLHPTLLGSLDHLSDLCSSIPMKSGLGADFHMVV